MEPILADLRIALRRLRRAPGFTLFAVASLALGVGTAVVVYAGVRTLMWQPAGLPHSRELVSIRNAGSWPDFVDLRRQQASFSALAASASQTVAVGAGRGSQTVFAELVSGDYFKVVGVRPRLGRFLDSSDESGSARVAVVSESFWKTNLGGDPGAVGRPIKLGGEIFDVVGVVDGPFQGLTPFFPQALWLPITAAPRASGGFGLSSRWFEQRSISVVRVWGRIAEGANARKAAAEVALVARQLDAMYPNGSGSSPRRWAHYADAATPPENETRNTVVFMVLAGIATVLLIACTNLANLALARETSRAQETAVRSALGASRWRLIREQLIEGALVVAAGGGAGVALARLFMDYEAVDIPFAPGVAIRFPQADYSIAVAAGAAMAMALAVFGLWPALQSTSADVRSALGAGGGSTAPKWRLHRTIIAWQVCGSVALLLVALLTVRVVVAAPAARQAAPTTHGDLALAQIDFALNGKDEPGMQTMTAAILDGMRAHPSIRAVAAANGLPFGWMTFRSGERTIVTTPESAGRSRDQGRTSVVIAVTPLFFTTTGMPLLRGRGFTDQDDAAAPPMAIVNEQAARELFRTLDVVGRTIYVTPPPPLPAASAGPGPTPTHPAPLVATRIVGVAANDEPWMSSGLVDSVVFVPFSQRYVRRAPVTFLARGGAATAAVGALRASIRDVDPDLAVSVAGVGSVLLDGPLILVRLIVVVTTAMGTLALVLSMVGLFGVLSHLVTKRTREIGVRLALGAERRDIVRLILRDGLRPVAKGLVLGLGIGAMARVAVKTFVVTDVSALDPLPLVLLPIPFAIAALVASYVPAARASRVDPNVALRDL